MKNAWNKWKEIAEKAGDKQATVVFSFLFYIVIMPIGLAVRLFTDFLHLKSNPTWQKVDISVDTLDEMKEQ